MKSRMFRIGWVLVALCISAVPAFADGETRPATPVEKDYTLRVLTAFEKALPAGPAGWSETDRTDVKAPENMGVGSAMSPLRVDFRVEWEDLAGKAAAQQRMIQESQSIELPDDAVMESMNAEMEALTLKMTKAAEKGDMAAMQGLQKEFESLGEKNRAAFAKTDAQVRKIEQSAPTDVELDIHFVVNQFDETLHSPLKQAPVSGLTVYRVEETDTNVPRPGTSYVFLGDWRERNQMEYLALSAEPRADRIPASVQAIMVQIRGNDARARQMLETIDWNGLKGLLEE